jgi:hypothetical protein
VTLAGTVGNRQPMRASQIQFIIDLWYKNAIIYSLESRPFFDGNGDSIGDF